MSMDTQLTAPAAKDTKRNGAKRSSSIQLPSSSEGGLDAVCLDVLPENVSCCVM